MYPKPDDWRIHILRCPGRKDRFQDIWPVPKYKGRTVIFWSRIVATGNNILNPYATGNNFLNPYATNWSYTVAFIFSATSHNTSLERCFFLYRIMPGYILAESSNMVWRRRVWEYYIDLRAPPTLRICGTW